MCLDLWLSHCCYELEEKAVTFEVLAYIIIFHLMIILTIVSSISHHLVFQDRVMDLSSFTVSGFCKE
jgi:hypothetical protein